MTSNACSVFRHPRRHSKRPWEPSVRLQPEQRQGIKGFAPAVILPDSGPTEGFLIEHPDGRLDYAFSEQEGYRRIDDELRKKTPKGCLGIAVLDFDSLHPDEDQRALNGPGMRVQ